MKLNLPSWYKNLIKETNDFKGLKSCMPFLDTLTTGYTLKLPQDLILIKDKIVQVDNSESDEYKYTNIIHGMEVGPKKDFNLNTNAIPQTHPFKQIENSYIPYLNKSDMVYKLLNPWHIQTPPGYSCLFIPPLNNRDDRFEIISGIVDTATFPNYVNFPIILNGDKYPVLETIIEQGTPYVQVIPFKRQSWKMEVKEDTQEKAVSELSILGKLTYVYKNFFWSKKSWK